MSSKPSILLVEDDDFAAMVTVEMLCADYDIHAVESGQAALDYLTQQQPDLIILDVEMDGISGYEVCRALRDDPMIEQMPVIFLSGKVTEEDRLNGYEAGGDDYLTKPVSGDELRAKIKLEFTKYIERRKLKSDLSSTFSTAMTAMSSSAEIGAILQFMRTSYSCPDYASLCREVINTMSSYGLSSSVKIHGHLGEAAFSTNGECSPLENSVLTNMSKQGRLFEFGIHTSCSYKHITLIMKSDARADPDRHGRMKDNIAWLAEAANERIMALDAEAVVATQNAALMTLTESIRVALQNLDSRHRTQALNHKQIFEELRTRFDRSMLSLGVTNSQEDELSGMLHDAAHKIEAQHQEGEQIGAQMELILQQLEQTSRAEA
ncbi:MAG: response regulator [Gallionellaceae bacterium]